MNYIKLSEYAKKMGVTYRTAQNWYYGGKIPNTRQMPTGTILVGIEADNTKDEYVAVYARVSTPSKKEDLARQAERVVRYANAKGYRVDRVVKEVASGLNDNRKQLNSILNDDKVTRIIVEHKDRLTRFGFNYIDTLSRRLGVEIEVVNGIDNEEDDIMTDLVSIITSFCARIYGKRRSKRITEKLTEELSNA